MIYIGIGNITTYKNKNQYSLEMPKNKIIITCRINKAQKTFR